MNIIYFTYLTSFRYNYYVVFFIISVFPFFRLIKPFPGYSFIKPLANDDMYSIEKEKPLVGVVKYTDGFLQEGDLVGFTPGSEYEFVIDGQRLYRVPTRKITIKYEYQGNEEEYNPSWT